MERSVCEIIDWSQISFIRDNNANTGLLHVILHPEFYVKIRAIMCPPSTSNRMKELFDMTRSNACKRSLKAAEDALELLNAARTNPPEKLDDSYNQSVYSQTHNFLVAMDRLSAAADSVIEQTDKMATFGSRQQIIDPVLLHPFINSDNVCDHGALLDWLRETRILVSFDDNTMVFNQHDVDKDTIVHCDNKRCLNSHRLEDIKWDHVLLRSEHDIKDWFARVYGDNDVPDLQTLDYYAHSGTTRCNRCFVPLPENVVTKLVAMGVLGHRSSIIQHGADNLDDDIDDFGDLDGILEEIDE